MLTRFNNEQLLRLHQEYRVSSKWSKSKITQLSKLFGCRRKKVYKWHWDKIKKRDEEALSAAG